MGAYEFTNTGPVTLNVSTTCSDTTGNGAAYYPFRSITKGMSVALAGDTVSVAAGTYDAANGEVFPISLKTGVALRGAGALTTTIRGSGSNPVVRALTTIDSSAVIDGFTITGGNSVDYGGGIRCWNSSPTITNNIITGNTAGTMGGGISCFNVANPIISNNIISGNTAPNPGGDGGGIGVYASSPVISNNTIKDNFANSAGGGIVCSNAASPVISNNVINGNYAEYGGGLSCDSSATIVNNTIAGNTAASDGGGIYSFSSVVIFNSIIWGNTGGSLYGCVATYSDIQGGGAGTGNIAADPLFVNAATSDYHLQPSSPCINKGTATGAPGTDKDGISRPQDVGFDIGAYEYVDITPPTGTISINSGAVATTLSTVTLNLTASDTGGSGLDKMRFSNDGTFDTEPWEDYATTRAGWILSVVTGRGTKTVYVQYKDNAGNISVGPLSDTIVLNPSNRNYVIMLYRTLLNRGPSWTPENDIEIGPWVNAIDSGVLTRDGEAYAMMFSHEYHRRMVDEMYRDILGRSSYDDGDSGREGWATAMDNGMTLRLMRAYIYGSVEFQIKYSTTTAYVHYLYDTILNRHGVYDSGAAGWINAINNGMLRWSAAYSFMSSDEYYTGYINARYQEILVRAPDSGGLQAWLGGMRGGLTEEVLPSRLYGSQEYFDRFAL